MVGMGTSYIVLLTAFYVDNGQRVPVWDRLPVLAFWIVPSLIGLPLMARALVRKRSLLSVKPVVRGVFLGGALVLISGLPAPGPAASSVTAQLAAGGRVLASSRGQVAWLDLLAPRPTPLTQLVRPAYPADVAAASSVPFAVASVVSALPSGGAMGADLLLIDLRSGTTRTLLSRQTDGESLDMPAIWPDGSGIVYQRSNLRAAVPMPGQAQPQYQSRIEQVALDGSGAIMLLDDARYPAPAPDGSLAFVRSTARGAGIFSHSLVDGSDQALVP